MQYIDKSKNEAAGKQLVDNLLTDSWCNIDNCYKGADYNGLSNYRSPIVRLMLDEQDSLCCYCLREIVETNTTLEHIIPHKINPTDFPSYLVIDELTNNVIHKDSFIRNQRVIPPNKYPHDIAYHNLIASCDSNAHCNHYRGNSKIEPLIFDKNIETRVEYDRAGNAFSETYENELEMLGLSLINSPLRFIRKIWHELAQKFKNISDITEEIIEDVIYDLISRFNGTQIIDDFTGDPSYKLDVLKYKWFFHYYKNNT
jgi:hypothetical protein